MPRLYHFTTYLLLYLLFSFAFCLIVSSAFVSAAESLPPSPVEPAADSPRDGDASLQLRAEGHDSRIDIFWRSQPGWSYRIYRAERPDGPFLHLADAPRSIPVYSDFLGENDRTFYYRIGRRGMGEDERIDPATARATSRKMTDTELLESIQRATFRYFWDFGHPVSGMASDRTRRREYVTTGGTGFGLMTIVVGAERNFVPREAAALRVRTILRFLEINARRFHGAWSHWMDGTTGRTIPFSKYDEGADLVETAFLAQGILTARQYFDRDDPIESEIRRTATRLWEGIEWDWFLREGENRLTWHWSPRYGWRMNMRIGGRMNECMIVYLLACASPTHPIDPSYYRRGWTGDPPTQYLNGRTFYGHRLTVGPNFGGPLFFTHYSFLGFDPRGRDRFCNYYENNRTISRIHREHGIENPGRYKGYGENCWGLTASYTPYGYRANSPTNDNGTITPMAAICSLPYMGAQSMAAIRHIYHRYGPRIWCEFGFRDGFNPTEDWVALDCLAIDQGPIVPMIENYRTGLCWRLFMSNPEIDPMLEKIEWRKEPEVFTPVEQ